MKLVKIEWVDSFGVSPDWRLIGEVKDKAHVCISVGYLAIDGANVKVIVPHLSPANKDIGSESQGCGDMAIPVSSIVSMVDLIDDPNYAMEV
jgi:hypothetical protein